MEENYQQPYSGYQESQESQTFDFKRILGILQEKTPNNNIIILLVSSLYNFNSVCPLLLLLVTNLQTMQQSLSIFQDKKRSPEQNTVSSTITSIQANCCTAINNHI